MIIPTPEFNPMFAHDGIAFRDKMIAYIQQEFADLIECNPAAAAALATLHAPPSSQAAIHSVTPAVPHAEADARGGNVRTRAA